MPYISYSSYRSSYLIANDLFYLSFLNRVCDQNNMQIFTASFSTLSAATSSISQASKANLMSTQGDINIFSSFSVDCTSRNSSFM